MNVFLSLSVLIMAERKMALLLVFGSGRVWLRLVRGFSLDCAQSVQFGSSTLLLNALFWYRL
jgi:hypothetical protein